ncbi:MAG: translation elongation factor Ts [Simkaniaceae bacterium]|nr:translation elongation factor Ts [Candidatus Sacchlamyda saccharinae]
MSNVTPQLIKELRELTGVGMGKCKVALEEAQGDLEKAIENLRKAGMASAVKKEGREANEGLIAIGESDKAVALVEVNSETDFVAQNEKFKNFLKEVADEAAETEPASLEALLSQKSKSDPSITIDEYRALTVQSLGENIQVKRMKVLAKSSDVSVGVYSHMGGKIVTAVVMTGGSGNEALARDIAMHVAAEAPEYLAPADVPEEINERERDIGRSQVTGKPENIIEKIVEGKVRAFYDQFCLLNQKYIKDNSVNIAAFLEKESKAAGKTLSVQSFLRWQIGE